MRRDTREQNPLPGLEDYVCTFQCLTHCPFLGGDCMWDDPYIGQFDLVEYPDFFWWRFDNLPENKKPIILTPDSMNEFYKEPIGNVYRCPRCLSTEITFGEIYIICNQCNYNEPLIDFPDNIEKEDEKRKGIAAGR